jgi:hypothetical protein
LLVCDLLTDIELSFFPSGESYCTMMILSFSMGEPINLDIMKKACWGLLVINIATMGELKSQTLASFSFSLNETSTFGWSDPGWTNVYGDPLTAVRSAKAGGITISSVSTANWVSANSACAEDCVAISWGTYFPGHILQCHWYQYSGSLAVYNPTAPQLQISGLNKDSSYILRLSSSYAFSTAGDPTRYTIAGRRVAASQYMNSYDNINSGISFLHVYPDSNGMIKVYVNTTAGRSAAYISGIQVISDVSILSIPAIVHRHTLILYKKDFASLKMVIVEHGKRK